MDEEQEAQEANLWDVKQLVVFPTDEYAQEKQTYRIAKNSWNLIIEEGDMFRAVKDKPDGTRVVEVILKAHLRGWRVDAVKVQE